MLDRLRRHRVYFGALIAPLAIWLTLKAVPGLDVQVGAPDVHVLVMTIVAACSILVASVAAHASMQLRQPGLVLLACGCLSVGLLLLGHGLTTPFALGQPLNQWVGRFAYLGLCTFALFLGASALFGARRWLRPIGEHAMAVLIATGGIVATFVGVIVASPTALGGAAPLAHEETIRMLAAGLSILILLPTSLVYWRRFRLSLDVVHASLSVAAVMTAAAFVSLHFGELWRLSWWDYHGCLLAGFAGVAYAVIRRWRTTTRATAALVNAFEDDPLVLIASGYPQELRALVDEIETKDAYTSGHSARTATLAVTIGVRLGLSSDDLRVLAQGAYLHDIGKLGIPDEILNKPGALTPEEREIINTHPGLGCELAAAHDVLEPCRPIIRHHHERMDGAGYPDRLRGEDIPLLARITAVADVWDALITDRAYRPGWAPQRALDFVVTGAGSHLDAAIVAVLLDIAADLGIHPSREAVETSVLSQVVGDCHEAGRATTDLTPIVNRSLAKASTIR